MRLIRASDTRERHLVAARLLGEAQTVLDVGGTPGSLASVLPSARVTTANAEPPADVVADASDLPFPDGAFDAAASLDVLEHLPPEQRAAHVAELARVAARTVVVCCPLGSDEHRALEAELRAEFPGHRFLEEHALYGLPGEAELRALPPGPPWSAQLFFHGSAPRAARRFRTDAQARRGRPPALARALRDRLAAPDLALRHAAAGAPNRAFLLLTRT